MKDQVHIVLATYNGENYLREQMDSLLAQTYDNLMIEVCDDGSTDRTVDLVKEYEARDKRVHLHQNPHNLGYVKNFLEGMKRSRAPYIMLCDQDDIWQKDKVEVTLEAMRREEEKGAERPVLVFTNAMNFDSASGTDTGLFHEASHLDVKKVDTAHLFMENKCIGCTMMMNHEILAYLDELPDEIRVHDWWLALICSHFGTIVYLPEATLRYRQHEGNMIGGSSYSGYFKKRIAHAGEQRQALRRTYQQGAAFCRVFEKRMAPEQLSAARCFAGMEQAGWLARRYRMIHFGFTKSGWIRNIGLFLMI